MPNHVTNILTVNGSQDELIIDSLFNEANEIDFNTFAPMPEELKSVSSPVRIVTQEERDAEIAEYERKVANNQPTLGATFSITKEMSDDYITRFGNNNWYDWSVTNWGTKWDLCEPVLSVNDNGSITISCETAWAPPIDAFDAMVQMGFDILAYYYEPGMQFAGIYTTDTHDEYDSWGDADGADQVLPAELNNFTE